ncbi:hypothetical protein UACE39S_04318 [Ureibacillus acetophenoni]
MRKLKIFSFLVVIYGMFLFTTNETQVSAAELVDNQEPLLKFDITKNEPQETTFIDENGNEVTLSIEPVVKKKSLGSINANDYGYLFPYGTSSYKVKGSNGLLTVTYYIDVFVSKVSDANSKILRAYEETYFCFGCAISDPDLAVNTKGNEAIFKCTTTFLGYASNSNKLRSTLSNGNELWVSIEF